MDAKSLFYALTCFLAAIVSAEATPPLWHHGSCWEDNQQIVFESCSAQGPITPCTNFTATFGIETEEACVIQGPACQWITGPGGSFCNADCSRLNETVCGTQPGCGYIPCVQDCSTLSVENCTQGFANSYCEHERDFQYNPIGCKQQKTELRPADKYVECPFNVSLQGSPCNEESCFVDGQTEFSADCVASIRSYCLANGDVDPACLLRDTKRVLAEGPGECPVDDRWLGTCQTNGASTSQDPCEPYNASRATCEASNSVCRFDMSTQCESISDVSCNNLFQSSELCLAESHCTWNSQGQICTDVCNTAYDSDHCAAASDVCVWRETAYCQTECSRYEESAFGFVRPNACSANPMCDFSGCAVDCTTLDGEDFLCNAEPHCWYMEGLCQFNSIDPNEEQPSCQFQKRTGSPCSQSVCLRSSQSVDPDVPPSACVEYISQYCSPFGVGNQDPYCSSSDVLNWLGSSPSTCAADAVYLGTCDSDWQYSECGEVLDEQSCGSTDGCTWSMFGQPQSSCEFDWEGKALCARAPQGSCGSGIYAHCFVQDGGCMANEQACLQENPEVCSPSFCTKRTSYGGCNPDCNELSAGPFRDLDAGACDLRPGCKARGCAAQCSSANDTDSCNALGRDGCSWINDECRPDCSRPDSQNQFCGGPGFMDWDPSVKQGCPFSNPTGGATPCDSQVCSALQAKEAITSDCTQVLASYCDTNPSDPGCNIKRVVNAIASTIDERSCFAGFTLVESCNAANNQGGSFNPCQEAGPDSCSSTPGCQLHEYMRCYWADNQDRMCHQFNGQEQQCNNLDGCQFTPGGCVSVCLGNVPNIGETACGQISGCSWQQQRDCNPNCPNNLDRSSCDALEPCGWSNCARTCDMDNEQECNSYYDEGCTWGNWDGEDQPQRCGVECWRADNECGFNDGGGGGGNGGGDDGGDNGTGNGFDRPDRGCPFTQEEGSGSPCLSPACEGGASQECLDFARVYCDDPDVNDPGCTDTTARMLWFARNQLECPAGSTYEGVCWNHPFQYDNNGTQCDKDWGKTECEAQPNGICSYRDPNEYGVDNGGCYAHCQVRSTSSDDCIAEPQCMYARCVLDDCASITNETECWEQAGDLGCKWQYPNPNDDRTPRIPVNTCGKDDFRSDACVPGGPAPGSEPGEECPFHQCPKTIDNPCHYLSPCENSNQDDGISDECVAFARLYCDVAFPDEGCLSPFVLDLFDAPPEYVNGTQDRCEAWEGAVTSACLFEMSLRPGLVGTPPATCSRFCASEFIDYYETCLEGITVNTEKLPQSLSQLYASCADNSPVEDYYTPGDNNCAASMETALSACGAASWQGLRDSCYSTCAAGFLSAYGTCLEGRLPASHNMKPKVEAFAQSCTANVPTVPAAPVNLAITVLSPTRLQFSWQPSTSGGAPTSYALSVSSDGGSSYDSVATGLFTTTYVMVELTPDTAYRFRVVGVNTAGSSAAATSASTTTASALAAPTISGLSAIGERGVTVTWTTVGGAADYLVIINGVASSLPPIVSTGSPHVVTGLSPAQSYTVSVAARSASGVVGVKSPQDQFTTSTPTPHTLRMPELFAMTYQELQVRVPVGGAYDTRAIWDRMDVWLSNATTTLQQETVLNPGNAPAHVVTFTGVDANTVYNVTARLVVGETSGQWSPTLRVTTPKAPLSAPLVSIDQQTQSTFRINWQEDPSNPGALGAATGAVCQVLEGDTIVLALSTPVLATSGDLTVTGLAASTTYNVRCLFSNRFGAYGPSSDATPATTTSLPPQIEALEATDAASQVGVQASDSIILRFDQATNQASMDGFLAWSPSLPGTTFSYTWNSATELEATLVTVGSPDGAPIVGSTRVTVLAGANLTAVGGGSASTSVSPYLTGNFGSVISIDYLNTDGTVYNCVQFQPCSFASMGIQLLENWTATGTHTVTFDSKVTPSSFTQPAAVLGDALGDAVFTSQESGLQKLTLVFQVVGAQTNVYALVVNVRPANTAPTVAVPASVELNSNTWENFALPIDPLDHPEAAKELAVTIFNQAGGGELRFAASSAGVVYATPFATPATSVTIRGTAAQLSAALAQLEGNFKPGEWVVSVLAISPAVVPGQLTRSAIARITIVSGCGPNGAAPALETARLEDGGRVLMLDLSGPVDLPTIADCSALFPLFVETKLGSAPFCVVDAPNGAIVVVLGAGATIVPGDTVEFKGSAVKSCAASSFSTDDSIPVSALEDVPEPQLTVIGSRSVGGCSAIRLYVVDSAQGGRPHASVQWAEASGLALVGGVWDEPVLALESSLLSPGTVYTFTVTVTNAFGGVGTEAVMVRVGTLPLPEVIIAGPAVQTVLRGPSGSSSQIIYATARLPECLVSENKRITWSWTDANFIMNSPATTPAIYLDRGLLPPTDQDIQLTVTAALDAQADLLANATVTVQVRSAPLRIRVPSGIRMSSEFASTLTASVFDPDLGAEYEDADAAGVTFQWTCQTAAGDACTDANTGTALSLASQTSSSFAVPTSQLYLGEYQFTVTATKGPRSASAVSIVTIVEGAAPPVVFIRGPSTLDQLNPTSAFALIATVAMPSSQQSVPEGVTYAWTVDEAGFEQYYTGANQAVLSVNPLRNDIFIPGRTYTFKVAATVPNGDGLGNALTGYSAISFTVNRRPLGGVLEISPSEGQALTTAFKISTSQWDDEDVASLEYTFFRVSVDGLAWTPLGARTRSNELSVPSLPAGSSANANLLTLGVVARDMYGASTRATAQVTVHPPAANTTAELVSDFERSVADAADSGDANVVLQLADTYAQAGAATDGDSSGLALTLLVGIQDNIESLNADAVLSTVSSITNVGTLNSEATAGVMGLLKSVLATRPPSDTDGGDADAYQAVTDALNAMLEGLAASIAGEGGARRLLAQDDEAAQAAAQVLVEEAYTLLEGVLADAAQNYLLGAGTEWVDPNTDAAARAMVARVDGTSTSFFEKELTSNNATIKARLTADDELGGGSVTMFDMYLYLGVPNPFTWDSTAELVSPAAVTVQLMDTETQTAFPSAPQITLYVELPFDAADCDGGSCEPACAVWRNDAWTTEVAGLSQVDVSSTVTRCVLASPDPAGATFGLVKVYTPETWRPVTTPVAEGATRAALWFDAPAAQLEAQGPITQDIVADLAAALNVDASRFDVLLLQQSSESSNVAAVYLDILPPAPDAGESAKRRRLLSTGPTSTAHELYEAMSALVADTVAGDNTYLSSAQAQWFGWQYLSTDKKVAEQCDGGVFESECPEPEPDVASEGSDTEWWLYVAIAGGAVVFLAIVLIIVKVCCCKGKSDWHPKDTNEDVEMASTKATIHRPQPTGSPQVGSQPGSQPGSPQAQEVAVVTM